MRMISGYHKSKQIEKIYRNGVLIFDNTASDVPVSLTAPSISGFPIPGEVHTVNLGTWSNTPTSYSVQIYKNAVLYSTLTTAPWTFTPVVADGGAYFEARVVATNENGSSSPAVSQQKLVISNVFQCYNPANISSLTIPTLDHISVAADVSGQGRNATSSTDANRPKTGGIINGLNAFVFDGTNDTFAIPTNPTTASLFVVIDPLSAPVSPSVSMTITAGSATGHVPIFQPSSTNSSVILNAGTASMSVNGDDISPANRGELFTILQNGGQPCFLEVRGYTGTTINRLGVGASSSVYAGLMGRVLYTTGVPSADELDALRQAFSDEWNLGFYIPEPPAGSGTQMISGDGSILTWGDGTAITWSDDNA